MATSTKAESAKDEAIKYVQFELPEPDHRRLKAIAALAGVSLAEYARTIVMEAVNRPGYLNGAASKIIAAATA